MIALKRGSPIGANDLSLAAHARSLGLTLVTNNTAEFARVKGLRVENWTSHRVVSVSATLPGLPRPVRA